MIEDEGNQTNISNTNTGSDVYDGGWSIKFVQEASCD
jgi:hypothetical protein